MLQFQDDIMKVKLMVIDLEERLTNKITSLEEKIIQLENEIIRLKNGKNNDLDSTLAQG